MKKPVILLLVIIFLAIITLILQPAITYKDVYSVETKSENCLVEIQTKTIIKKNGFLRNVSSPYKVYMFPVKSDGFEFSNNVIMKFSTMGEARIYSSSVEKSGGGVSALVEDLPKSSLIVELKSDHLIACKAELSYNLVKYFSFRRLEA